MLLIYYAKSDLVIFFLLSTEVLKIKQKTKISIKIYWKNLFLTVLSYIGGPKERLNLI